MYFVSFSTFGILLLFRASFAQSAPRGEYYEDEEALIDRLAKLAAVVGPDALSKQMLSSQYDLPPVGYYRDLNDEMLAREALASLPRQFAYKPDDPRFYMSADQFPVQSPPNYYPEEKAENSYRSGKAVEDETVGERFSEVPASLPVNPSPQQYSPQYVGMHENSNVVQDHVESNGDPRTSHFMKKNQPGDINLGHADEQIIADPSHLGLSQHSAESNMNIRPINNDPSSFTQKDFMYIGIIAASCATVVLAVVGAGVCWYRIHQRVKAAAEVEYPAYGVTGPSKDVSPSGGDRKLAQSAHMYHYQHQKQQMAALQKGTIQGDRQGSGGSDVESEDDNEDDNDYTVYECPGLAPAGEMEVKNPLFQDEATPATPQPAKAENDK